MIDPNSHEWTKQGRWKASWFHRASPPMAIGSPAAGGAGRRHNFIETTREINKEEEKNSGAECEHKSIKGDGQIGPRTATRTPPIPPSPFRTIESLRDTTLISRGNEETSSSVAAVSLGDWITDSKLTKHRGRLKGHVVDL